MIANRNRMRLKRDLEVKISLSEALGADWLKRDGSGRFHDQTKLREITVGNSAREDAILARLEKEMRYPGAIPGRAPDKPDFLLAEVIQFCPVALPVWQQRAHDIFQGRVVFWREQLATLRQALEKVTVYTVPFGRFLLDEGPEDWVSDVLSCNVDASQFFEEWAGDDGVRQDIWYFRRPFLVWPMEAPGSLIHTIRLPDGSYPAIRRPPLEHPLLGDPALAPIVEEIPTGRWTRLLKRVGI